MKSLKQLMSLRGRVALITGGAGKIGSVMAEALAELGADIFILDRSAEHCDQICYDISNRFNVRSFPLVIDLTSQDQIRQVPANIVKEYSKLDVVVNCAGFIGASKLKGWITPFEEQLPDTWTSALEVNLTAPFILTQSCLHLIKKSKHASIINVSSIYGVVGPDMRIYDGTDMGNPAAYAASKGGLLQFTRWLATTLAPHIRVNAISPGGIERNQPESFTKKYIDKTPLKRMGKEEDLKGAVAYLASDMSLYVTGQNLVVDGGWTAW